MGTEWEEADCGDWQKSNAANGLSSFASATVRLWPSLPVIITKRAGQVSEITHLWTTQAILSMVFIMTCGQRPNTVQIRS